MAELAYLQVARLCNQKCLFCSNPVNGRVIAWEEAKALVDRFVKEGAAGVILTGGEPTLFPELPRLIAYAHKSGLPTRLITNGQKTAQPDFLQALCDAGLEHMHVSVHSHRAGVQARLSGKPDSLKNITATLENARNLKIRVDINTVINKLNVDHLSGLVSWLTGAFPYLRHFVWNNLDPLMNAASLNPELVPKLADFEVELHRAMTFLHESGRNFRVERVPLCFMSDFPHRSTETRKLVKEEGRRIFFLDAKGLCAQGKSSWSYGKAERCGLCPVNSVCAGLYQMDAYYSSKELCPVFLDPAEVARRVREDA